MSHPNFSIVKTIKERRSVRAYEARAGLADDFEKLCNYFTSLSNPFSIKVSLHPIVKEAASNADKLGTYGIISGAKHYIAASVPDVELGLEALGYEFEMMILYATHLGLGTCWLGGTFNRNEFAATLDLQNDEIFPIVSPIGYPSGKKRLQDTLLRKVAKSDQRKPWKELFFLFDFDIPLTEKDAGAFFLPLEMLRLAPSASNKQPWRIVKEGDTFHFYEAKLPGYSDKRAYDIQRIDIGIAACHFHLTAMEQGLKGHFEKLPPPETLYSQYLQYIFSWISE